MLNTKAPDSIVRRIPKLICPPGDSPNLASTHGSRFTTRLVGRVGLLLLLGLAVQQVCAERAACNLNLNWRLNVGDVPGGESVGYDDAMWKTVTLPHAWNEDAAFKVSIEEHPTGIAWYRKTFKLPAHAAGKKVFLEFEGVRQGGEFYVNGKFIGRHENGVTAVGFDVTGHMKPEPEENIVAVRTDNAWDYREKLGNSRYQWNDKNFNANYGGIPKNVKLHVMDRLHQTLPLYSNLKTTGVYIHASEFDLTAKAATITAESEVHNEYGEPKTFSYEVALLDMNGKLVKEFSTGTTTLAPGATQVVKASERVSALNFWSWGYGYLYDVQTTLKVDGKAVDTVSTRTGFRKTEFGEGVVRLNGRVLQMKGYAQRTSNEWPALGSAVPPWLSDFSNGLMVEGNGNLVRWMHVTPSKQDVESCDRVGLIQAMPAGDSEKDATGRWWTQRVEVMRDAIIYNRNNPSILFYESGNAGISEAHMAEMKALRDQYDPHGGRAIGSRNMLDSQVAEFGGEMLYINKSAGKPMWMMEYSRDEALRKYWDDWTPPYHKDGDGPPHRDAPAREYNRNQDTFAVEAVARWYDYWRERPGTGERVNSGGVNIIFSDSNTHHRGAENYRRSGEVDAMRIPKDAFFAHQVMWDGWVDVENPRLHIVGHWNYAAGVKKPVYAVSSADKVELFVNGKSQGYGEQSCRFLFTWKEVAFAAGEIKAIGYDSKGKKLCEAKMATAGSPVALKLTPRTAPNGLKADAADVALVDVEVVDAKGNRCPTAMNLIQFTLEGPAEWRGGLAQGRPDNYLLAKELPVECGINRVLLRSLSQAGRIVLSASAEGLKPGRIELVSSPVATEGGLSQIFPDAGLPSYLGRGPTPATDSVAPTRKTLRIVKATAGVDAEKASLAFDDNEASGWKNDGKRSTGWIQFELERPGTVSEVVVKLGGWRRKSYPLRITVDGQEAYSGVTPKSLGYVTLPLKPTPGKLVRIELVGTIDDKDGFGMVEVTGKKLPDTADFGTPGALEVIEAEIYESLAAATKLAQQ
jgi:beta-galactosidase